VKYYICDKKGPTINILKEISADEYAAWRKCTKQLRYYSMAKHFRDMAVQNGLEVEHYLKGIQQIKDPTAIKNMDATAIAQKANRLMLNYLVSFRTYVDNLQAYSKHIKGGALFKKNILNWIYDNEIVYSFFSHLRNFATHYSLIFDKATIEPTGFTLECSKEHILEYSEWKAIDKKYIESCDGESLPILEGVEHLNVLIVSIYFGFIQYFAEDIQDMHNQVMPLMHEYQILNPLFIESESATNLSGANVLGLGLEILKEVTDELASLPNTNITYITPDQVLKGEI